jgi:hypothetical protein
MCHFQEATPLNTDSWASWPAATYFRQPADKIAPAAVTQCHDDGQLVIAVIGQLMQPAGCHDDTPLMKSDSFRPLIAPIKATIGQLLASYH